MWIDSYLVLVLAWFALLQVNNKHERSIVKWPPSGGTSRLGSREPVDDMIRCGPRSAWKSKVWCMVLVQRGLMHG
jgi:hypothetical protein